MTLPARRINLTGGNIQRIPLRAAFAAPAGEGRIAMHHVVRATRQELISAPTRHYSLRNRGKLSKPSESWRLT